MRSVGLKTLTGAALITAAMVSPALAGGLSGSADVTTNYLFRGITQTSDDPAVQAGINYDLYEGLSVGVWASSIDFGSGDPGRLETDFTATYTKTVGPVDLSAGVIYYAYFTNPSSSKYNFFEGWVGASHDFGPFSAFLNFYYSPEFFGITDSAYYINPGIDIPICDWLSASGSYGYQKVDSTGYFGTTDEYSNWNLGLTASYKAYSLGLMYSQTDLSGSAGDPKVVATLSASF